MVAMAIIPRTFHCRVTRQQDLFVGISALVLARVAYSEDDDTIPLAQWVAEFDQKCVETIDALSDPDLSEAEFTEVRDAAIEEMPTIGESDEMADTAAGLPDAIGANTDGIERTQAEIDALDQQALAAMTSLGVSDVCISDPQG
jgi:hypothetical protein